MGPIALSYTHLINYAGLVRGDTQRAVKLEITGTRNDELIAYLDDIVSDLTSGDGHYELVKLKDAAYQERDVYKRQDRSWPIASLGTSFSRNA